MERNSDKLDVSRKNVKDLVPVVTLIVPVEGAVVSLESGPLVCVLPRHSPLSLSLHLRPSVGRRRPLEEGVRVLLKAQA